MISHAAANEEDVAILDDIVFPLHVREVLGFRLFHGSQAVQVFESGNFRR